MRSLIVILITILMTTSSFASGVGKGPLKLSNTTVVVFIEYLKGGYGKKPGTFFVTTDGDGYFYYYCPEGSCQPTPIRTAIKKCEQAWQKECKLFANKRTIKWKNDINPGKGKESRINSRWSDSEIKNKLRELGFYD